MKHKKTLLLLFLSIFICEGAFSNETKAIFSEQKYKIFPTPSLRGLKKISISMVNLIDKEYGINDNWIRSYIEGRLKKEGIEIIEGKMKEDEAFLILYVKTPTSDCFEYRLGIYQKAYLARDSSISCHAATWYQSYTDPIIPPVSGHILDAISYVLDEFLKAYRKENPKK